jgi:hypothetical protein
MTFRQNHTFYNYDHARDGQIVVGTIVSPWFDVQGLGSAWLRASFTTGTTQVFLDFSNDALTVASSTADLKAAASAADSSNCGTVVGLPNKYVRVRIVQTVATTTVAQLGASIAESGHYFIPSQAQYGPGPVGGFDNGVNPPLPASNPGPTGEAQVVNKQN